MIYIISSSHKSVRLNQYPCPYVTKISSFSLISLIATTAIIQSHIFLKNAFDFKTETDSYIFLSFSLCALAPSLHKWPKYVGLFVISGKPIAEYVSLITNW